MQHPLVSVVIVAFKRPDLLLRNVEVLSKTAYEPYEIIVIDNGLGVDRCSLQVTGEVRVVNVPTNVGFAEGANLGASEARGDYLAFLNDDVEVDSEWLSELIAFMEMNPKVAACQCLLLKLPDRHQVDSAGDLIDAYGFGLKGAFGHCNTLRAPKAIFSFRGAASVVRKEVFYEAEMFDPQFFFGYEDVDLSWRIRLLGFDVMLFPSSVAYHWGESSGEMAFRAFHSTKNRISMILKNYELRSLLSHFFGVVALNVALILYELLKGHKSIGLARSRGILWVAKNFSLIWKKRLKVQRLRVLPDSAVMQLFHKGTVLALYLRFTEIGGDRRLPPLRNCC